MRKSGENIMFFHQFKHAKSCTTSYLVPEREYVCPPTTVQLPRTNTTSCDNPTAMSIRDSVPTITKGATPSEHYIHLHGHIFVSLGTLGAPNCPATMHCRNINFVGS